MARTTARTTAAKSSPARKAAGRPPAKRQAPVAKKTVAKKAPGAKKTVAKKAPAKKAVAKKAVAKKAPAKKTVAKKTVAKKTVAKTAPGAKKTVAKRGPAKKTVAKKTVAKKTVAKRAPAGTTRARRLAVKANEKPWTAAELAEVKTELTGDRSRLRAELNIVEGELQVLMRDAGDGAGNDQADVGSATFERDHEMTLANNAREMLAQTERALARIADGSYGVCESCGEPIGKMRLMAFPRATLCLSCKQREERR
ncbi:MAG: histone H1-like repetitive region-containing protein [Nocardioidaceae bacterium]